MTFYPAPAFAGMKVELQTTASQPQIKDLLKKNYLELFKYASHSQRTEDRIEAYKETLEREKDREEDRLDNRKDRIEEGIDQAQEDLKNLNEGPEDSKRVEEERHRLHCVIQKSRAELKDVELSLDKGIENKYDNLEAKLEILRDWPEEYRNVLRQIEEGRAGERKFGDYKDVGFRSGPFEGQEEDVKKGREAIDNLKQRDMLPPEIEDEEINAYIDKIADRIARNSDLQVPLKMTLLQSKEINAFALPGGFLFLNSGLVTAVDNESQLAGVIAHEIAHAAARHGDRLMGKANIANIIFQAAQVAAMILTGGASSLATYYLLRYGFVGLGLVLNLSLLGVSRDYEIEADILGTQYLWHANYDLSGFIDFFGKMAEKEGYISGLSWFRTHPPFSDRMKRTYEEMLFLPDREEVRTDSEQFRNMQKRLEGILDKMEQKDKDAPTMRRVYECENVEIS
jgi:hypothetical protein